MTEESNINIFVSTNNNLVVVNTNPDIDVINDIEFIQEFIISSEKYEKLNEKYEKLNFNSYYTTEENTTPTIVESQRYNIIIETLGLNINIDYSINVLTDAIIEMHTINKNNNNNYIAPHTRCFQFKTNSLSNKIKTNLSAHGYLNNYFSKKDIKYALKSIFHKYKYDKVISGIDKNEKVILTQHQEPMIGFNYNNPRWNTLSSYTFDIGSN